MRPIEDIRADLDAWGPGLTPRNWARLQTRLAADVPALLAGRDAALAVIAKVRDYVAEDLSEPDEDGERLRLFVYPSQIRALLPAAVPTEEPTP